MTARVEATKARAAVLALGLTACVLVVSGTIEAIAWLLGARSAGPWLWLGGALVVACVVPLVRPEIDRAADRLAFGREGDPYAVLSGFARRLSETLAIDDVLPQLAQTAAQALRSPAGEVRVWLTDGSEWRQTWPPGQDQATAGFSLDLEHSGERVGRLDVAAPEQAPGAADRELLARLSGSAGLALSNVRLTVELRQRLVQTTALAEGIRLSRQRLVEAGSDQRARFASAVETKVLTHLSGVDDALGAAESRGERASLVGAEEAAMAALDELREIAAGVYPAGLREWGLVHALSARFDRGDRRVRVHAADPNGSRHARDVEAGAYFCCVSLVDEMGDPVDVTVGGDNVALVFTVVGTRPQSPDTGEFVRDRVEGLGGQLTALRHDAGYEVSGRLPVDGVSLLGGVNLLAGLEGRGVLSSAATAQAGSTTSRRPVP